MCLTGLPRITSNALVNCPVVASELAPVDLTCWDSLSAGDIGAFARQAPVCPDLRPFGICARLIDDG